MLWLKGVMAKVSFKAGLQVTKEGRFNGVPKAETFI